MATRLVEKGYDVGVYCRKHIIKYKEKTYKGIKIIRLFSIANKYLDTPVSTLISLFHLIFHPVNVVQLYGIGNSIFIPLLKLFRYKVVSVVDGLDWKRGKWGRFASWFLRTSEWFAVLFADYYVVDSQEVVKYYKKKFPWSNPIYVPYGANVISLKETEVPKKYNLKPQKYALFVGRLVPEKGVHHLIKAFESLKTDFQLAIVGDNIYDRGYVESLKATKSENIKFLGFVYGNDYVQLCANAYLYVQPSILEGTSPALLTAMALGNCVLVSNIPENLETIGTAGISFDIEKQEKGLREKLQYLLENPDVVDKFRKEAVERILQNYSWDKVTEDYEKLFIQLVNKKT